jgi:hypothetical protein
MRKVCYRCFFIISFLGVSCHQNQIKNGLSKFDHVDSLSVFAPELSLKDNTFKGSFSDDYTSFFFFRKKAPNQEIYIPYTAKFNGTNWETPKKALYYNASHSYTYQLKVPRTKTLIFLSNKRTESDTTKTPNYNFWFTEKQKDQYTLPKELGPKSLIKHYNSQPSIAQNGTIYFTSDTPDWSQTTSYSMRLLNGAYQEPVPFKPVNDWRKKKHWNVFEFCITPKEDIMIVSIEDTSQQKPNADLYISFKNEFDTWSTPKRLQNKINTSKTENFPTITADGKYLLFTRAFSQFYIIPIQLLKD